MLPLTAAAACFAFVLYCLWRDAKENPDSSPALWVPLIWMFLAGSRYVSSWMNLGGDSSSTFYDEGSPLDAAVFALLIVAGLIILARRSEHWADLASRNKLVAIYLIYCLVSVIWSDDPLIGVRRWIKDLGNPIMALIILSEPRPAHALGQTLRRFAYLVLPLSVVFVRYYPEYGRTYHFGVPLYTGAGHQKNALGQMCLVTGLYFAWQVLADRETYKAWTRSRRIRLWILAGMAFYLIDLSDSKTSLACLLVGIGVLWCARLGAVRRQPMRLLGIVAFIAIAALLAEWMFGIRDEVLRALDRDVGLTNRTDLWALLLPLNTSPLVGAGFMSFWTGERMQEVWALLGAGVLQAHSGYIEQYLNLGYLGVGFIVAMLFKGMLDARANALYDPAFSALRLTLIFVAVAYNYTEAAFYGINNIWLLLLFALVNRSPPVEAKAIEPETSSQPIEFNGVNNAPASTR
jgi:hypothetical protein